jgi:hypothetical protein
MATHRSRPGEKTPFNREFALMVPHRLSWVLEAVEQTELQLQVIYEIRMEHVVCRWYHQGTVECSRKQIYPILQAVLESKAHA